MLRGFRLRALEPYLEISRRLPQEPVLIDDVGRQAVADINDVSRLRGQPGLQPDAGERAIDMAMGHGARGIAIERPLGMPAGPLFPARRQQTVTVQRLERRLKPGIGPD